MNEALTRLKQTVTSNIESEKYGKKSAKKKHAHFPRSSKQSKSARTIHFLTSSLLITHPHARTLTAHRPTMDNGT